jgi:hypothetical protein
MSYWRNISPRGAFGDLLEIWSQPNPHRWQVLGVALAMTFAIFAVAIPDSQRGEPARPSVTYITTYAEGRTDEEIIASNIANQRRQEELNAQREAAAERRRELYRALGRATGLDVDEMEREIAAQRAAEEAAAEREQQAIARQAQQQRQEQAVEGE